MDLSRFTIIGEQERKTTLKLQNARLVKLRWLYLGSLSAIAAVSNFIAGHHEAGVGYVLIGLVGILLNGVLFAANRFSNNKMVLQSLMVLQLALDLSIATLATYVQGGLDARTTALYALPIVAAGLIFSHSIVYFTALMSGVGYITGVLLYESGQQNIHISELLVPLVFYPAFFVIFARLVVYLMRVTTEETREQAYDAFLALLSHQLKQPASAANAIIDYMENTPSKSPNDQKKYVTMLKAENQHLMLLLNNLLETAAPVSKVRNTDTVDLPRLLQQLAHQCAEGHSRTADLKLKLQDMSLTIEANSERLKTALLNILNNAFQYSKPGTPVTISLRKTTDNVIITVEDQGEGMSKDSRRQLFRKYSLHEPAGLGIQGLGLGLFVSKKIVSAFDGSFHVVTNKDGTKVIITLKRGNPHE